MWVPSIKKYVFLIGMIIIPGICGCGSASAAEEGVNAAEYLSEDALSGTKEQALDAYVIKDAVRGSFAVTEEANAQFYIQDSIAVYAEYEYGTMIFDEYLAEAGDYLEAGEAIAKVHIDVSEADLTEAGLKLQRKKERLETDQILYDKEDALLREEAYNTKGSQAQGIAMRLYEESLELHRQDIERQEKEIAEAEKDLSEMEEAKTLQTITAPTEGYLKKIPVLSFGDEIEDEILVGVLEPKKSAILKVNNEENAFRYGKEVTIICKKGTEETVFTGEVITPSKNSVAVQASDGKACILPEEKGRTYLLENEVSSIVVKVNTIEQENVVLLPLGMLEENNSTYATIVQEDGSFLKKKVVIGGKNEDYYWIIDGLQVGERVVAP